MIVDIRWDFKCLDDGTIKNYLTIVYSSNRVETVEYDLWDLINPKYKEEVEAFLILEELSGT